MYNSSVFQQVCLLFREYEKIVDQKIMQIHPGFPLKANCVYTQEPNCKSEISVILQDCRR